MRTSRVHIVSRLEMIRVDELQQAYLMKSWLLLVPSGKRLHSYSNSPFRIGKPSWAIINSYGSLNRGWD